MHNYIRFVLRIVENHLTRAEAMVKDKALARFKDEIEASSRALQDEAELIKKALSELESERPNKKEFLLLTPIYSDSTALFKDAMAATRLLDSIA